VRRVADPTLEDTERNRIEQDAKRRDFSLLLVRLDQMMDSYAQALSKRGAPRADTQADNLEVAIRKLVLDQEVVVLGGNRPAKAPGEHYRHLKATAADASDQANQGIALAALGFSGEFELMPTILQGAMLSNPDLVDRAVFGLAVLGAPDTPVGVLADVVDNQKHPIDGRTQAAWAIFRLQQRNGNGTEIAPLWQRWLSTDRDAVPPGVLVTAVRGLGLTRDTAYADLVAGYLKNPTNKLREAAANALGRMKAQAHAGALIDLLGPEEPVPNVRLSARKALQELAGRVDHGYDTAAWRKVFERG
jgi:hypothetical protein